MLGINGIKSLPIPGNLAKLRALKNAAVYFPRLKTREVDTETERERSKIIGPAAAVAGIMARIDATRGVWKAPAGILAEIRGIEGLDISLTTQQIGNLSKQGINSIRTFDTRTLCWGARTVVGYAHGDPEWKYLPVRRLALYIEESLNRGTDWVVFEPNDEPTWAVIRMSVGTFMFDLFRQGAFQGVSPKDAFFVKCDGQTTTQADQNRGIVNITVGFAPLKPAEFVIFKIQKTMVET